MTKKIKPSSSFNKKNQTRPKQNLTWELFQILVVTVFFFLIPSQNVYSFKSVTQIYQPLPKLVPPAPAPYPVNKQILPIPELTAVGIMVVDIPSRVTMYSRNKDLALYPASTTKIMTALVVLDEYKLDEEVKVKTVIT